MNLNRKISSGAILILLMLLLGGVAAALTLGRMTETARAVRRGDEILQALDKTLTLAVDIEAGTRGYVLTGRDEFLEPYHGARQELPGTLERMRALMSEGHEGQVERLAELDSAVVERLAISDEIIHVRRTQGLQSAADVVGAGRGKAAMDRIRDLVAELQDAERRVLVLRTEADRKNAARLFGVLVVTFSLSALVVVGATALLEIGITRRTRRLLTGLARSSAGDSQVQVEPGPSDEIGTLALGFNEIVRRRRLVEEERARATALLDGLFRASPLAFVLLDVEGKIQMWNPAAEGIFGWTAKEAIGRQLPQVLYRSGVEEDGAMLCEGVLGRRETVTGVEGKRRRRNGGLVDTCASFAPIVAAGEIVGMLEVIEDITLRNLALERLRESEERFRLALDEAPVGMALVALDGRFIRVNRALCEIVGYSNEELTGLSLQSITHPESLDADLALAARLSRSEIPRYQLAKRYVRKDGGVVDVMLSASILRARDGTPRYYIAQIEDITDRKSAEDALRRSEAQFRGLMEHLPDGVFVDAAGRVVYANGALARLLGVDDQDALLGKPSGELFHPEDVQTVRERIRELEAGHAVPPRELRMLRADRSTQFVETTGIQVHFDGQPSILVVARDLTDRKRVEREREEALERMRVVLDVAPVCILISQDGYHWDANKRVHALHGREFDPKVLSEYQGQLLDAEEEPLLFDELPGVRALRGERIEGMDLRVRRTDGRIVPVLVNAAPIPATANHAQGAVVTIEDISALKELERLRMEWSSVVAHDLRQPLNTIMLCAELVAHQTAESVVVHRARQITDLSHRLNRMIEDLLDFSRLEAKKLALHRERMELEPVLREAAERIALEAPNRAIDVEIRGPAAHVLADRDRISQVMDNLLTNAVKYGTPGTPIVVEAETKGAEASVAVTNQGPGIAPEQLPNLFARFQRLDHAKRRGIQGVGLGLYITRELLEAHGGRIVAESVPGERTTFRFTLPLARE